MKESLSAEQDFNNSTESFYAGVMTPITHVRVARLMTVLETTSECVIVIVTQFVCLMRKETGENSFSTDVTSVKRI